VSGSRPQSPELFSTGSATAPWFSKTLPKLDVAPDPDDNFLLALAEAGEAQFLVTGDKPLLGLKRHKSTQIVTPAALLELLKEGNK
jgi:predicted nucleic acid-binding protein